MDTDAEGAQSPQKALDPAASDDEPLVASANVNIADIGDEKPLHCARKKLPTRPRNKVFSRIERLIEQQLLQDTEQPIWNASDGAVQDLLDDTLPLVAPTYENAPRKAPKTKHPALRKEPKKSPRPSRKTPVGHKTSKKWRFRDLGSDESDDEPLALGGNVDDMIRNAEHAARKAGEGAPDEEIAIQTRKTLDDLLIEYRDEIITAEDLAPKAKRPRVTLGPAEFRVRRLRDTGESVRRSGDSKALVKKGKSVSASKPTNGGTWGKIVDDWSSDEGVNNSSKDWWKKDSWNDDKKWHDKNNGWDDNSWTEKPVVPVKKRTIKISEAVKQAFLERRNTTGSLGSLGSLRGYGQTIIDPIAARRNIALQRKICGEYARMASFSGLRS